MAKRLQIKQKATETKSHIFVRNHKTEFLEHTFILFDYDTEESEKYQRRMVHFYADNHQFFTGTEILFKLNNELYPLLQDSDFIYFEGIHCYQLAIDEQTKRTTCQVLLGS